MDTQFSLCENGWKSDKKKKYIYETEYPRKHTNVNLVHVGKWRPNKKKKIWSDNKRKRDRNTLLRFHSSRGSVIQRFTFFIYWIIFFFFSPLLTLIEIDKQMCTPKQMNLHYTQYVQDTIPSHGFNHRLQYVYVSLWFRSHANYIFLWTMWATNTHSNQMQKFKLIWKKNFNLTAISMTPFLFNSIKKMIIMQIALISMPNFFQKKNKILSFKWMVFPFCSELINQHTHTHNPECVIVTRSLSTEIHARYYYYFFFCW